MAEYSGKMRWAEKMEKNPKAISKKPRLDSALGIGYSPILMYRADGLYQWYAFRQDGTRYAATGAFKIGK